MSWLQATTAILDWLNNSTGLWTAIAAVSASLATLEALKANRTANLVVQESRASIRPWITTNSAETTNMPGGFQAQVTLQNYGTEVAVNPRITVWQVGEDSLVTDVSENDASMEISPGQNFTWVHEFESVEPDDAKCLILRVKYSGQAGRPFESWTFYRWPITVKRGLSHTMHHAGAKRATELRGILATRP